MVILIDILGAVDTIKTIDAIETIDAIDTIDAMGYFFQKVFADADIVLYHG